MRRRWAIALRPTSEAWALSPTGASVTAVRLREAYVDRFWTRRGAERARRRLAASVSFLTEPYVKRVDR